MLVTLPSSSKLRTVWFGALCSVAILIFSAAFFVFIERESSLVVQRPDSSPVVAREEPPQRTIEELSITEIVPSAIMFLGDIMLGRSVELWMNDQGVGYPFQNLPAIIGSSSVVIANFEASIPVEHKPTPSGNMRFSINESFIPPLFAAGITHVSLANNHTLDYGEAGFRHTKKVLSDNRISSFGHSTIIATSSRMYTTVGTQRIGVLALHTLFVQPDTSKIAPLLEEMSTHSDRQIVYIHWGTEYETTHSDEQETLARTLIALGADAIIGHHPHVVQDIDVIDGVPVFYSLGNFIFDQYFSQDVQVGLALSLRESNQTLFFDIIPVTSIPNRSQPQLMNATETVAFLTHVAKRSNPALNIQINAGTLIWQ